MYYSILPLKCLYIPTSAFLQRRHPRRIIMGTIVNHELLWTEVRIKQLSNIVDLFIIMESSMTSGELLSNTIFSVVYLLHQGGDSKKLNFKEALENGYLSEYQYKIMYLHLKEIPYKYIDDGWLAEMYELALLKNIYKA